MQATSILENQPTVIVLNAVVTNSPRWEIKAVRIVVKMNTLMEIPLHHNVVRTLFFRICNSLLRDFDFFSLEISCYILQQFETS